MLGFYQQSLACKIPHNEPNTNVPINYNSRVLRDFVLGFWGMSIEVGAPNKYKCIKMKETASTAAFY
jgi:hypothetical protein